MGGLRIAYRNFLPTYKSIDFCLILEIGACQSRVSRTRSRKAGIQLLNEIGNVLSRLLFRTLRRATENILVVGIERGYAHQLTGEGVSHLEKVVALPHFAFERIAGFLASFVNLLVTLFHRTPFRKVLPGDTERRLEGVLYFPHLFEKVGV